VNNRGPVSFADLAALDFTSAKRLRLLILERPARGIYPCLRLGLRLLPSWRCEGFRSHHDFLPLCSATIAARTASGPPTVATVAGVARPKPGPLRRQQSRDLGRRPCRSQSHPEPSRGVGVLREPHPSGGEEAPSGRLRVGLPQTPTRSHLVCRSRSQGFSGDFTFPKRLHFAERQP
jgi:hypothetical protein